MDGLPASFAMDALGLSKAAVKRAKENQEFQSGRSITNAIYAESVTRNKIPEGMAHIFKHFFSRSTHVCSGASNDKARIMDMEYYE